MATASNNAPPAATNAGETSASNVPQWKRDLIQRRRQQNKVLASNGASVKLCSAVFASSAADANNEQTGDQQEKNNRARPADECNVVTASTILSGSESNNSLSSVDGGGGAVAIAKPAGASSSISSSRSSGGATAAPIVATAASSAGAADFAPPSVACNMRLEADLSLCSDTEDVLNGSASTKSTDMERNSEASENEDSRSEVLAKKPPAIPCDDSGRSVCRSNRIGRDVFAELSKTKTEKFLIEATKNRTMKNDDAESDSSEELQYGPGIVNRLKSKYLNLTLREMNDSRTSVQRFRRAASLENLLDRDEEVAEKSVVRKYTKRNAAGVAAKTERYRNASRGNESMKRARSVETLMRYNGPEENSLHSGYVGTNGVRQEPANDHIILIDRTSVKIESRLGELERPKAINKPKRVKPVLAETERPPPDLVKTTMRIFESSAKRVKPKGEVAAKVATFKTINDTLKAQTQKKIVPKPPIQPKPFVNGNSRSAGSPKKIVLPQKPTAELIENQGGQEYHIDGVITDPIVQSVSSVVSKFQQIEKAQSPSPSPEPSYKIKFSPAPSPEPLANKMRSNLEISVKSPPTTPVHSPRISSPRLQSPGSPRKDFPIRQNSSPVQRTSPPSPCRELLKQVSAPESSKIESPQTDENSGPESLRQQVSERLQPPPSEIVAEPKDAESKVPSTSGPEEQDTENVEEEVDGPKVISQSALENIGKAGTTMQFSFNDKPSTEKSYLPGAKQDREKIVVEDQLNASAIDIKPIPEIKSWSQPPESCAPSLENVVPRLQERLETTKQLNNKEVEIGKVKSIAENKPIGAICSLGLMRSSTTTTYPQGNESKTIRSQKTESPSPPQKQIGIIRPLVSTKTQLPQQNLSNRELEKNLINRVKSIEQPTKVVVSLKSADEIQPVKKAGPGGGGGLWETKPWNQQNNTMVFNFSNRKDVPDYIENDGLIIRRKREKPKVGDGGIIVLDATLDASTTDDAEWEISGGPPSPCDVSFLNDNVLINGRSNLSRQPRNHKHRIQFDDTATRTFEYPSEASMLEGESSSTDGATSGSAEQSTPASNKTPSLNNTGTNMPSLLGGGGLASYTPSKVDLTSDGFELGVTRTVPLTQTTTVAAATNQEQSQTEVDYLKPAQDAGAWGSETTGDLLY